MDFYLATHKKCANLAIVMLSKINQTRKTMCFLSYAESLSKHITCFCYETKRGTVRRSYKKVEGGGREVNRTFT